MPTKYIIIGLFGLGILSFFSIVLAYDAPHNLVEGIDCDSCHTMHAQFGASYTGLTKMSNENLCLSCHTAGGTAKAGNWPLAPSDQAVPGSSGTSHSWSGALPLSSSPNNKYGLRAYVDLAVPKLKSIVNKYQGCSDPAYTTQAACTAALKTWQYYLSCSVCHQQHGHSMAAYDPYSLDALVGDGGTATGGALNTLTDSTKNWTINGWQNFSVIIAGAANAATAPNVGLVRTILSNNPGNITASANFLVAPQAGDRYYIQKTASAAMSTVGTTTGLGSSNTVVIGGSWPNNTWKGYYVKLLGGDLGGQRRWILSNNTTTLTTLPFEDVVLNGQQYYITTGRHFMRANNGLNEMCNDCHYYRTPQSAPLTCSNDRSRTCTIATQVADCGGTFCSATSQTDVKTWDGNKKSHPIGKNLKAYDINNNPNGVQDAAQFVGNFAVEPQSASWAQQGGTPRGHLDGGTDTNLTNNVTLGIDGKISCLSCHRMHYADSDSSTVDTYTGYAP
ncbi:MAG TPA: cytochrome c3 family protein [Thermodesulfovibrionales bacterium]|nr:cytochrome c3 family protein [Thermodesulfovibrionales bacterium]